MDKIKSVNVCLDYLDEQLDQSSEQVINIAELIIDDIKDMTDAYSSKMKKDELHQYCQDIREAQLNWINQLQDIILQQVHRDLSGQVIGALKGFTAQIERFNLDTIDFETPTLVNRHLESKQGRNGEEYLDQDAIEQLFHEQPTEH